MLILFNIDEKNCMWFICMWFIIYRGRCVMQDCFENLIRISIKPGKHFSNVSICIQK